MLERPFLVEYTQRVLFTRGAFEPTNSAIVDLVRQGSEGTTKPKVLIFLDQDLAEADTGLLARMARFFKKQAASLELVAEPVLVPGGEVCKNDFHYVQDAWSKVHELGMDRHSWIFAIGGGALLDMVSFAASTAHRGIRHVRFPTTTLSQGDGGVGVKNGVNYFGKKNWVGSFSVPYAIVNDAAFLDTLPVREKRCGLIEAVKVSLIRDAEFYHWIEKEVDSLANFEPEALEEIVKRSAEAHVDHIVTNGDPFERGSARPLDFGHWVAHKLEQVSNFRVKHGEAVAIGMAVDLLYSVKVGILEEATAERILKLIEALGFDIFAAELLEKTPTGQAVILQGLEEFREHLGGELTITLVPEIGKKLEVHEMDEAKIIESVKELQARAEALCVV